VRLKIGFAAVLLALVATFPGCGYRFSDGGDLPADVSRIAIHTFENRTGETGIEIIVTNDVINEFNRHPNVAVTGADDAEAVLTGVIRSTRTRSLSHRSAYTTAEREITIWVDVTLTGVDGKVLWSARGIEAAEDYAVSPEKIRTEQNRKSAVAILSGRLAQRIFYRMTDRF
jgi:outer membrane lipopolysaccharide assembly protein LptE/RlpB